ncbi:hypothetical protein N9001_07255 [Akkermansiaceae bacterium]|nr:hypothetical protein [Akkermansiaceae bacterium]
MPESITFSTPSILPKAARAFLAAPHPPPLKDTVNPSMVDAATSSASARGSDCYRGYCSEGTHHAKSNCCIHSKEILTHENGSASGVFQFVVID